MHAGQGQVRRRSFPVENEDDVSRRGRGATATVQLAPVAVDRRSALLTLIMYGSKGWARFSIDLRIARFPPIFSPKVRLLWGHLLRLFSTVSKYRHGVRAYAMSKFNISKF